MTYLAVPIAAKDKSEACEQINTARNEGAEILELRTDYLSEPTVDKVKELIGCAEKTKLPVIVTCRDSAQGGASDLPLSFRRDVLIEALRLGVEFIDCEFDNFLLPDVQKRLKQALEENNGGRIILSAHNFEGPWQKGKLSQLCDDIKSACQNAIPKLVYKAEHINDCFEVFDLLHSKDGDVIAFCMGTDGFISRILAKKFGSFLSFASLSDNSATATGQITIKQLKSLYHWQSINAGTEIFGVIGNPVGHSLSPAIFNALFEAADINALYLPVLVRGEKEEFHEFIGGIASRDYLGFGGFSVTIPHKTNALDYVNTIGEYVEPLAENIGAVNTLKVGFNSIVSGYNTDYAGALDALVAALDIDKHGLHGTSIAVVGAGGAARAVVAGLADVGAKIIIYNRTVSKARFLSEEFNCKYAPLAAIADVDAKIIINCTSIGMYPNTDASVVPPECLRSDMVVFDTVYNPLETKLLQYAAQAGAETINGAEMFVRQAIAQYKIFTGSDPDEKIIRKTIFNCLTGNS